MSVFLTRLHLPNPSNIILRNVQSNAALLENCTNINNRNPRNLELLRIARKPAGYHLENPTREHWHKLSIIRTSKHVTMEIQHFLNGTVISASSKEWPIKKYLYRYTDTATYINIGRILAQRCLESGIIFVSNDLNSENSEKIKLALKELINGGVILIEPSRYKHAAPWDLEISEKPWEIQEN